MDLHIYIGILLPFIGTAIGAALVFFMKKEPGAWWQCVLNGFAAGVMVAASVWSLLIPAIDCSSGMGFFSFVPAVVGFWLGVLFLLLVDRLIPHLHRLGENTEGPRSHFHRSTMLILSVTIHNIPEGMAVGVVYAGYLSGEPGITVAGALALSIGIALQNFPEGAIVSMPLAANGIPQTKAFGKGILSAVAELFGAIFTLMAASLVTPILPYLLSFAAGAMIFVVVEELIPEMSGGRYGDLGTICFAFGFSIMMLLDVALG